MKAEKCTGSGDERPKSRMMILQIRYAMWWPFWSGENAKSKKLIKLKVDTGLGHRTVFEWGSQSISNPNFWYVSSDDANQPCAKKDDGNRYSEGMILMAEDKDGKLKLLQRNEGTAMDRR